jgi:SAM-dependent methyltransferase
MMLKAHLDLFACPHCGHALQPLAIGGEAASPRLNEAAIACTLGHQFIVCGGIVRFMKGDEQGAIAAERTRRYGRSILDSARGTRSAEQLFTRVTGLSTERLAGKRVLEIGSHGGRFAEWVAHYASHLIIVDPTEAIDVCRDNLGELANVTYAQVDPARLPFGTGGFDFVYILDGLDYVHTPRETLQSAVRCLRAGGEIAFNLQRPGGMRYRLLRPLTLRLPYRVVEAFLRGFYSTLLPPANRSERRARRGAVERRVLQDLEAFTTPYLWHIRPSQINLWLAECGLTLIEKGYSPRRYRARKMPSTESGVGRPPALPQAIATRAGR